MKPKILYAAALLVVILLSSCKTLQSTKGYEKYPKNYDWKTDVL